ncbi:(+)-neomenthol dehydrogenase [Psilocybe cubensis]|uniref:Uncharacterized protein n=2 Tax=Psilocybe cubensis TaxID=181762 RepID=A0A8H7XNI0_PSICU|nr:(+)-neomenthol dehydrogenase [Psilocybe cubensis]KAH9478042.1 (+)-neomenthol dehydrogenase [Psilocybe cubensis]
MSKVILVTGSNSSIGFELVRILAEKGHTVYLSARNEEAGLEAQKILHAKGLTNVKFVLLDIRDTASIERAKNTIEEAEGRLDALVNNAAISRNDTLRRASELDIAVFKDIMETNFVGLVQTTTAFVPLLRKSSDPSIVNVSSGLGSSTYQTRRGQPTLFTAYAVSKAAVNSYTVNLSQDLEKEGFKVNAVCPGLVSSRLNNFIEGGKSLEAGAQAIEPFVLLDKDGPTGKFYSQGVEMEW